MENIIYQNNYIYIEIHQSQIPWLKIFTQNPYKEFSECDKQTKFEILKALETIEIAMIKYFNPEKINIASFGNYLPHVHFHVMARFKNDDYFPESMWGVKQRDNELLIDKKKLENFYFKVIPSLM